MWQNQWTAPSEWMVQEGFWQKRMSHENIREEITFWTEKRAGEENPKGGKNGLRMIDQLFKTWKEKSSTGFIWVHVFLFSVMLKYIHKTLRCI